MNLYVLRPRNRHEGPWEHKYDRNFGFIVKAFSPKVARELAARASSSEGEEAWLDYRLSTCKTLKLGTAPGIVMSDFNAG